jgi:hypothetical protein
MAGYQCPVCKGVGQCGEAGCSNMGGVCPFCAGKRLDASRDRRPHGPMGAFEALSAMQRWHERQRQKDERIKRLTRRWLHDHPHLRA